MMTTPPRPHDSTRHDSFTARDREVIRVGFENDRMGIAAALRRAFADAASERSSHDFDRLLEDLN